VGRQTDSTAFDCVERTLLSAAVDVDFEFELDLVFDMKEMGMT
jgi:hypothetical protein